MLAYWEAEDTCIQSFAYFTAKQPFATSFDLLLVYIYPRVDRTKLGYFMAQNPLLTIAQQFH